MSLTCFLPFFPQDHGLRFQHEAMVSASFRSLALFRYVGDFARLAVVVPLSRTFQPFPDVDQAVSKYPCGLKS